MTDQEKEVFEQEVSPQEMELVSAGDRGNKTNCEQCVERDIYGGEGFPNCASSAEEGSRYSFKKPGNNGFVLEEARAGLLFRE